jgi:hypothetical protein
MSATSQRRCCCVSTKQCGAKLNDRQRKAWWLLLDEEIGSGVPSKIDDDVLKQKNYGRYSARSRRRLARYGASFAGTAAEYVHSLWHDVSIRFGREFLPARPMKRHLDLLSRWFPPAPGHRLFPDSDHL